METGGEYQGNPHPYGYFSEATKTLVMKGHEKPSWFKIKINPEQAQNVVRVWIEFADGQGCRTIAKGLNKDGVPAPYNRLGGASQWTDKVVWNMLNQSKYLGYWPYRRTKVLRNPSTDRLVQKDRPENEHITNQIEELRIIPPDLEMRVNERKLNIIEERKSNKTASFYSKGSVPKHLFVGSMKCGACDGNVVVVTGKAGGYLGCFNYYRQASIKCGNGQTIRMLWVENALLAELGRHLDNPEVHRSIAKSYNQKMGAFVRNVPQKLEQVESQIFR